MYKFFMPKFRDALHLSSHTSLAVLEGSARVARNSELLTLYVPSRNPSSKSQNERETTLDTNYALKAYCKGLCILLWAAVTHHCCRANQLIPCGHSAVTSYCTTMLGLQMLYNMCPCARNVPSVYSYSHISGSVGIKTLGETELQIWQEKQLPKRLCPFSPCKQKRGSPPMPCQLTFQLHPKSSFVLFTFISFEL